MDNWLRVMLALVAAAHGVGHLLFLLSLLGVAEWGQPSRSWLLGDAWLAKGLGSLIWLVATAGFIAVAVGIFNESAWWRSLAIISSVTSCLGLFLFWVNPTTSPAVSALIFNLLVLGSLIVLHWPPSLEASGS